MSSRGYSDGIRSLGRGRYQVRVKVGGRPVVKTLPSLQAAQAVRNWLRTRNVAAQLGMPEPPKPAPALTLELAFDSYIAGMKSLGRAPESIAQVEYVKGLWMRKVGKSHPAALTYDDLVAYAGWARANTRSKRGRAIQAAIAIARSVVKRARLPVPEAPQVAVEKRRPKTVPRDRIALFLAELPPGSLERTYAEVIFRTARRDAEVRRLRVADIDLDAGVLVFRRLKGKNRGEDPHPIGPTLARILRVYLASQCQGLAPEEPLFGLESTRDGDRARHALDVWSLAKRLEPAARKAGVGKRVRTLGWLRNQAATDARKAGVGLDTVSLALGHADVSTTARHYVEDRRWAARERLGKKLDDQLPATGYPDDPGVTRRGRTGVKAARRKRLPQRGRKA